MQSIYLVRLKVVLSVLGIIAVISGCSGDKPSETLQSAIEPPAPVTTDDEPDPVSESSDQDVIEDFRTKVKTCVDQLLDDDVVISLLYSRFFEGGSAWGGGYGSWYDSSVNYNDLASFWPMSRGFDAVNGDLCEDGIQGSLQALARLAGSGRYNPYEVSNFVGDIGLSVTNQGWLYDIYNGVGSLYATDLGSGGWGFVVGNRFFRTTTSASTEGLLGRFRSGQSDRGVTGKRTVEVTAANIPASLPRGIQRQLRGLMAEVRESNGSTAQVHSKAKKALSSRHLLR